MKRLSILLVAACASALLLASSAAASPACNQMKSWLVSGGGGASGLLVVDAETGKTVCASGAGRPLPLASNMKMFTTATALSELGPEHTIATKVFRDGKIDSRGVLHGSLYLQGGGDPALGTPGFDRSYLGGLGTDILSLRPQIRAAGIKSITGRLYADDSIFDRLRGVADSGYATSSYIGPLSGLAFNAGFRGNSSGSGFSSDPARSAAKALVRSLRNGGIAMPAATAFAVTPPNAERVAIIESAPLTELVDLTNIYSNNFFAEMLIKLLGADVGASGTTAAGGAVVERFAGSLGSTVHAVDGSGLTRSNRAAPREVIDLLLGMRRQEVGDEFIQDLALSGAEGTVDGRMIGTAANRRCRVKTGTLTGVSNLSGYCFNKSGKVMAFSILMGSVGNLTLAHQRQDQIAGLVASY
ncbi:MAG TPA: D-alanyl-D-alanine carboxypeptidase/D-alanyl-D-alanine-endopeptidase [Solirubrobacterales bacterium]|jgi:D-alanyl-D-alanine carboxypeptidase/D-alanyl-D-alanine-endopeptidase (penicillin-binding protein 4)|nr:D-alanyl-D-alanine carboxypeptidase/D-alanyl-D-alanine-endopeptidase [Solirubrobacterales bacterium]